MMNDVSDNEQMFFGDPNGYHALVWRTPDQAQSMCSVWSNQAFFVPPKHRYYTALLGYNGSYAYEQVFVTPLSLANFLSSGVVFSEGNTARNESLRALCLLCVHGSANLDVVAQHADEDPSDTENMILRIVPALTHRKLQYLADWLREYQKGRSRLETVHSGVHRRLVHFRFHEHLTRWRQETATESSGTALVAHPSYQAIMEMGLDVVPHILTDLANGGRHWSVALGEILRGQGLGEFPRLDPGDMKQQAQAWLAWLGAQYIGIAPNGKVTLNGIFDR